MTVPKINTIRRKGARFYVEPDSGEKVPGVTSVLSMLPKEFLRYWAAKMVAESAVEQLPTVLQMVLNGQDAAAVDFLKKAPDRNTGEAARIGSDAHDLFERLAKGEDIGRVHPDLEPFVRHFRDFLDTVQPELTFMEETVWSEKHGYAGSFDAYGKINGQNLWLDWKTTRSGVHEEVGLQLAAYAHADFILRPDGSRIPLPKSDGGAVLHVRPEGWKLVPVRIDDDMFEIFLHLRQVFEYEKNVKSTVVGKPVYAGGGE